MAKEDIINTYTAGVRKYSDNYVGVTYYHHDLDTVLKLYNSIVSQWDRFEGNNEFFIRKDQEMVGDYMQSNCDNISREEAQALAEKHGFTLEEICWHPSYGE